jgi:hypothetical protein
MLKFHGKISSQRKAAQSDISFFVLFFSFSKHENLDLALHPELLPLKHCWVLEKKK